MKNIFFNLLGSGWFFHLMIFVIFAPVFFWNLDPRIGMLLFGVLITLVSSVEYLKVTKEHPRLEGDQASFIGANRVGCLGRLQQALSGFFILFGLFTIVTMVVFFIVGQELSAER